MLVVSFFSKKLPDKPPKKDKISLNYFKRTTSSQESRSIRVSRSSQELRKEKLQPWDSTRLPKWLLTTTLSDADSQNGELSSKSEKNFQLT